MSDFELSVGAVASEWISELCRWRRYWGWGGGWVSLRNSRWEAVVEPYKGRHTGSTYLGSFDDDEAAKAACDAELRRLGAIRNPVVKDGLKEVICFLAIRRHTYQEDEIAACLEVGERYAHHGAKVTLPRCPLLEGDTHVRAVKRAAYTKLGWEITEGQGYTQHLTHVLTDVCGDELWHTYAYKGSWERSTLWVSWWDLCNRSLQSRYGKALYKLARNLPESSNNKEKELQRRENERQAEQHRWYWSSDAEAVRFRKINEEMREAEKKYPR